MGYAKIKGRFCLLDRSFGDFILKNALSYVATGFFTLAAREWRMRIDDVNVSTTEQHLGVWHDDVMRGADASVDVIDALEHQLEAQMLRHKYVQHLVGSTSGQLK